MLAYLGKICVRVVDALGWRLHGLLGDRVVYGTLVGGARIWRRLLTKPIFIGVTGSAGKTTTTKLLVGILSRGRRALGNRGSYNNTEEIARAILSLRPTHHFFVSEVTEGRPGALDKPLALLQPSIGIVTVIGNDHWSAFQSRDAIAAEVGKLIARLPPSGTAVLNADDERVRAMAADCAGKVITYGLLPDAQIRAEGVGATWPDRLQMTIVRGSERMKVHTQLCGSHWIPSVLAAVAGGIAAGVTMDECAKGIANVAPFEGRMQPVLTPEGVTFVRDDWKASLWTLDSCFEFMSAARAKRKVIVIGTLSDYATGAGAAKHYADVAKRAQQIADITVFVGTWASSALKARQPGDQDKLRAFSHVRHAAEYVNSITREGDLVLLKGTNLQDHLYRVILARTTDVACWRDDCHRNLVCDACSDRTRPSGVSAAMSTAATSVDIPRIQVPHRRIIGSDEQVIVGLGNPESRYSGTPHNVGYDVVDALAASLELAWDTYPDAWIARGTPKGQPVCLIKIRIGMNHTGMALKQLSESMSFAPEHCILVHDDLDMPLGSVRTRLRGGAGGHRGVASILEAFQSDSFRRVKIGVGQPTMRQNRVEYVLTSFAQANRAAVDRAILVAEARVLEWVGHNGIERAH